MRAQRGEVDAPVAVDDGLGVAAATRAASRTIAGIVGHVTSLRTLMSSLVAASENVANVL